MDTVTIKISKVNSTIIIQRGEWTYGQNPGHRYANPTPASRTRVMRLVAGCEPQEKQLSTVYEI